MNTFLKTIKQQGKALLITGAQGAGKTLLSACLSKESRTARISVTELLSPGPKSWPRCDPEVVIVSGFPSTEADMLQLRPLIAAGRMRYESVGQGAQWADTPLFVFEAYEPAPLPVDGRRFYTIELDR